MGMDAPKAIVAKHEQWRVETGHFLGVFLQKSGSIRTCSFPCEVTSPGSGAPEQLDGNRSAAFAIPAASLFP